MQILGLSHLFKSSIPAEFAGVGGEARSKGGEPEVEGWCLQGLLQGDEDARAADVAISAEYFPCLGELTVRQCRLKRFHDIASPGVRDDFFRITRPEFVEFFHSLGGQGRHGTMELVFEFSVGIHEADFLPVLRLVDCPEI
jgi:hypothetical protein